MTLMPVSSPADNDGLGATSRTHIRTAFDLTVRASYQIAFPLFGSNGERSWAGDDWNPQFVYPLPAVDVPGAVFTINHGAHQAVWVNTAFDRQGRHIQYTYLISDVMVTTIDLTFVPLDSASTKVSVVYERTALNAAADGKVQKLATIDQARGTDWEKAINAYLKQQ
jgi:hypothetical protein